MRQTRVKNQKTVQHKQTNPKRVRRGKIQSKLLGKRAKTGSVKQNMTNKERTFITKQEMTN